MTILSDALIACCALFFLWMGMKSLRDPLNFLVPMGIQAASVSARNEIRAVYGGFGVTIALLLAASLVWRTYAAGIALTVSLSMAGMALGRVISALVERKLPRLPRVFLFLELALAAALLVATVYGRR